MKRGCSDSGTSGSKTSLASKPAASGARERHDDCEQVIQRWESRWGREAVLDTDDMIAEAVGGDTVAIKRAHLMGDQGVLPIDRVALLTAEKQLTCQLETSKRNLRGGIVDGAAAFRAHTRLKKTWRRLM